MIPGPSFSPQPETLELSLGVDCTYYLCLIPARSVLGMTVEWRARSGQVTFAFPPITILPSDSLYYPAIPLVFASSPQLGVIPGVQPDMPTRGNTVLLTKSSLTAIDAARGIFRLPFVADDTKNLLPDNYAWQLRRIDVGAVEVLKEGILCLRPSPW